MKRGPVWVLCSILFGISCSGPGGPADQEEKVAFSVILITDVGGLGDKGFNDAGWAGCEEAKRRLADRGVEIAIHVIESREQTDYNNNLTLAAERADVVVSLGFLIADAVAEAAPHYPDKAFIFIDGKLEAANVASFEFKSNEGGFLAGLLAGAVTQTGTIAVLPGMDIPPVESFAAGYRAGAKTYGALTGRSITVLSNTIGSFNDPVKAKSMAQSLNRQGADILFQLAGNSGLGVIEAVRETPPGHFVIGVDVNQDDLAPGKVLTSVLKRMDRVVADQIEKAYDHTIQFGVFSVGSREGYVGLTEMVHTRQGVPEAAWTLIQNAQKLIAEGTLQVPAAYAELDRFEPPVALLKTP